MSVSRLLSELSIFSPQYSEASNSTLSSHLSFWATWYSVSFRSLVGRMSFSFFCLFVSPSCKYLIFFFIISILNIFLSTWCFKICFHSGDLGFLICFFPRWGHYSIILWLFSLPHYFCSLLFLTPISWILGLLDLSVYVLTFSLWHGSPPPPSPSHKGNVLPFVQRPQHVSLTLHRLLYFHIVFLISKLSFNKCSPCTF